MRLVTWEAAVVVGVMELAANPARAQPPRRQAVPAGWYDAPAGAPYVALAVTVAVDSGPALGGTLTLPCAAPRPLAAVVLVSGSGPEDRDGGVPPDPYRPLRDVADTLSRRGIAVLRLDDRGVGQGDFHHRSSITRVAADVRAALAYLRARGDVDSARLGVMGHSEGGAVAPMLAAEDSTLRLIALLGAPGQRLGDALREQVSTSVARDRSLATPAARDSALRVRSAYLDRTIQRMWGAGELEYDPLATARAVRSAAVLVLQGETDWQVLPRQAGALGAAFREAGNPDVTVRVFPEVDHLMLRDPDGDPDGYEQLPSQRVAPEVLGALADWAAARLDEPAPALGQGRSRGDARICR
ncbi:MAG TPA: alpha/beta hydrolase [Longimicrobiaceae bacterium]|jgi:dienelactone hydrolase|nr:alpha/beta hydrolase [Longimicrobiaceae bacterium]